MLLPIIVIQLAPSAQGSRVVSRTDRHVPVRSTPFHHRDVGSSPNSRLAQLPVAVQSSSTRSRMRRSRAVLDFTRLADQFGDCSPSVEEGTSVSSTQGPSILQNSDTPAVSAADLARPRAGYVPVTLESTPPAPHSPATSSMPGPRSSSFFEYCTYELRDGTRQEQGRQFLDTVAAMLDKGDQSLIRGRLIIKSASSPAIDQGGLSVSLIEYAAAELADRLGRSGQLLHNQQMDMAFVPRSPTIDTDAERMDLMLLGALIGIVDNHRTMVPDLMMTLPIPLPAVLFRALLTINGTVQVDHDNARDTALADVYHQWCGDRSPAECVQDNQIDVVHLLGSVPGINDDNSADEYLNGLVGTLLSSQAFQAIQQGFLAATLGVPSVDVEFYRSIHDDVVADTVTTFKTMSMKTCVYLGRNLNCCERHAARAYHVVYWALRGMSDRQRADFLEAATGSRFLPLSHSAHANIHIWVVPGDGIAFRTCLRTVVIPAALVCAGATALRSHLLDLVYGFSREGISRDSHNVA
ncbi:unnamed protein product (mitochondrion) [Plasmodiophora brassicae]|uniref:HECT domain-containing protein n=1 Tax=Plasmodiophora brassicae TaxID=37360 RepID=A0A3P3YDV1_PLABS|nr:unnamed protein product [Plasmodiophora brassicae]